MKKNSSLTALLLLCLLTGCVVGPDYHTPALCMPVHFSEERDEIEPAVEECLASWWRCFDDPFLEELLAESIGGNFDWKIALEQICQARAAYWMSVTNLLPDFESSAQATRSRTSQNLVNNTFKGIPATNNFFQAGIDAIWQIDLFGGLQRAASASGDLWQASIESAREVGITMLSEVAITYTNICALQEALFIANQRVVLDEKLVSLSDSLYLGGLIDLSQIENQIATLESDRAAAIDLDTTWRQTIYSLATLLGRPPEGLLEQFLVKRPIPCAFGKIPIGLPSDLLRRRPDIRMQERQIAAATEQIGVAVAALFPQFSLTGSSSSFSANPLQGANTGFASNTLNNLFTAPSRIWGIGLLMNLPIFDFGKRIANIAAQVSVERQALFAYEKTVINALQEVESALVAYFNDEHKLIALENESTASKVSLDVKKDQYLAGLIPLSTLLSAEELYLSTLSALNLGRQALTSDLIALYNALGGGWLCSSTL